MSKVKFNKQQQDAIDRVDGAYAVIASAGSGKSTLLIERIRKLVKEHKIPEHQILAVTFTKNSSNDLIKKLNEVDVKHVDVGTFHSICGKILHKEGINIVSNMVQEWQIDNWFKNIDQQADTKEIMNFISFQKNRMIMPDDKFVLRDSAYSEEELRTFYKMYEEMKNKEGLYDFDDYLLLTLDILKNNPGKYTYDYILVDEHQDSNGVQNLLLKEWCQSGNLFVVGDYRQNIYEFRSSDNDYLMNMNKYWKDAETLNVYINYRSPRNIVNKSNEFIKKYYGDYKHYVDAKAHIQEDGCIETKSHFSRDVEAVEVVDKIEKLIDNGEKLNEIAVLYRNNKHADFVENELKRRGIEYDIANDSSFFKRREVAGILSFLRLVLDTDDDNAFEGVFRLRTYPLMYFSNAILNKMKNYANQEGVSLFDAMQEISYPQVWYRKNVRIFVNGIRQLQQMLDDDEHVVSIINQIVKTYKIEKMIKDKYRNKEEREERLESIDVLKSFVKNNDLEQFLKYVYSNTEKKKSKDNAVRLMTIHRSKGLEFDNVFIVGVQDGEFPNERADILEEARLFYVAVTRSKKNLWVNEIGRDNRFVKEYGGTESSTENNVEDDILNSVKEKLVMF